MDSLFNEIKSRFVQSILFVPREEKRNACAKAWNPRTGDYTLAECLRKDHIWNKVDSPLKEKASFQAQDMKQGCLSRELNIFYHVYGIQLWLLSWSNLTSSKKYILHCVLPNCTHTDLTGTEEKYSQNSLYLATYNILQYFLSWHQLYFIFENVNCDINFMSHFENSSVDCGELNRHNRLESQQQSYYCKGEARSCLSTRSVSEENE